MGQMLREQLFFKTFHVRSVECVELRATGLVHLKTFDFSPKRLFHIYKVFGILSSDLGGGPVYGLTAPSQGRYRVVTGGLNCPGRDVQAAL